MKKLLKNVSGSIIKLKDVGTNIKEDDIFEVPYDEIHRFLDSTDTVVEIRNGNLQVGDGDQYYTDPMDGEVYFKTLFGDNAYIHDGTSIQEYTTMMVEDEPTGKKGTTLFLDILTLMREFYNAPGDPLYVPDFQPLLGAGGREEERDGRILNLEEIHGRTGWHRQEIIQGSYKAPLNILFYYGWLNSFNSNTNGWVNEVVAQDLSKYGMIVLGDGIQDPGHGDYSNTQVIIPRVKQLNDETLIFGYISMTETQANFETKADQWNTLGVHGIFIDEGGYDFGTTATNGREAANAKYDYVHSLGSANIVFVNSWNMDHIIGTANDVSYPNSTWNPSLVESTLTEEDWYLLEAFAVDTESYGSDYEVSTDWVYRGEKAVGHRYNYGIKLAGVSKIDDSHPSGQAIFKFGFVSACMFALEAYGSSSVFYGASTAQVNFWTRPDTTSMAKIWQAYPSVTVDVADSDVYWRFVERGSFKIDFSSGEETSSITILIEAPASSSSPKSGYVTTDGSGDATVTFGTAFSDTNYAIVVSAQYTDDNATAMWHSKAVGGFSVKTMNDQGNNEPSVLVNWVATPFSNP